MTHSLSRKFWITPDSGYRVASAGRAMKMSDGQGASRVIRPDRRGPGALGDRRENVAALERAWRAVDRAEERRVGKECVSTVRSRWSPNNSKTKHRRIAQST